MALQDLCLATIVALLVVLALALARWAARRRAERRRAAAAGAQLVSDLRGMMGACEALAAIAPEAAGACRQLGRGLASSVPANAFGNANSSAFANANANASAHRDLVALYSELSASSELSAAAAAYERAALAARGGASAAAGGAAGALTPAPPKNTALAAALARCASQLRAVVASVHRLGVALELE